MKKFLLVLAIALLAPITQAQASSLDFNVGLNIGLPFAAAHVYTAAPVYYQPPVRVCQVDNIRYPDGYGERHHGYESRQAYRHGGQIRYREFRERNRGWDRDNHDRWGR